MQCNIAAQRSLHKQFLLSVNIVLLRPVYTCSQQMLHTLSKVCVQALQESLKYASKSQKEDKADLTASLNERIAATSAFLEAQHLFNSDAAAAVQICNGLVVQVRTFLTTLHQLRPLSNSIVTYAVRSWSV